MSGLDLVGRSRGGRLLQTVRLFRGHGRRAQVTRRLVQSRMVVVVVLVAGLLMVVMEHGHLVGRVRVAAVKGGRCCTGRRRGRGHRRIHGRRRRTARVAARRVTVNRVHSAVQMLSGARRMYELAVLVRMMKVLLVLLLLLILLL